MPLPLRASWPQRQRLAAGTGFFGAGLVFAAGFFAAGFAGFLADVFFAAFLAVFAIFGPPTRPHDRSKSSGYGL